MTFPTDGTWNLPILLEPTRSLPAHWIQPGSRLAASAAHRAEVFHVLNERCLLLPMLLRCVSPTWQSHVEHIAVVQLGSDQGVIMNRVLSL